MRGWTDKCPPDLRPLAQHVITPHLTSQLREMQSHPDYVPPADPAALAARDAEAEAALLELFKDSSRASQASSHGTPNGRPMTGDDKPANASSAPAPMRSTPMAAAFITRPSS